MYGLGDILQAALADILEWDFYDLANLIVDGLRDANSSSLRQLFESNGKVHAGAVKIVVLGNHITQINANAELHPSLLGDRRVAPRNLVLYLDSAANGLDDAGEFRDNAVPCTAEDMTPMRGNRFLDYCTIHAQSSSGGFFVELGKVAVTLYIGSKNRGEPPFHGRAPQEATPMERTYIVYVIGSPEAR